MKSWIYIGNQAKPARQGKDQKSQSNSKMEKKKDFNKKSMESLWPEIGLCLGHCH